MLLASEDIKQKQNERTNERIVVTLDWLIELTPSQPGRVVLGRIQSPKP